LGLLVVFALVAATVAHSPSSGGTLKGTVKDSWAGVPVPDAYLLVYLSGSPEGPAEHLRVARDGTYTMSLGPGYYDVFVVAKGFAPTCREIRINAGKTEVFDARLGLSRFATAN
jgi:hypothetical protein